MGVKDHFDKLTARCGRCDGPSDNTPVPVREAWVRDLVESIVVVSNTRSMPISTQEF